MITMHYIQTYKEHIYTSCLEKETTVFHSRFAAASAGVHQACGDVAEAPAILSLGVGDGAVLLTEVKPQLTLVAEMEVTFFTLRRKRHMNVALHRTKDGEGVSPSSAGRHAGLTGMLTW